MSTTLKKSFPAGTLVKWSASAENFHTSSGGMILNEDTTLKDIESMHGHSEAEHKVSIEHSRNCQTLGKDNDNSVEAEPQSIFGSVEDLIAMGYSGNLEFERDFLGEGLDMIGNFQL